MTNTPIKNIRKPGQITDTEALAKELLQTTAEEPNSELEQKNKNESEVKTEQKDKDEMTAEKLAALPAKDRWRYGLKLFNVPEELALEIIDAQLDPGYWKQTKTIFFDRVQVTFRSRDHVALWRAKKVIAGIANPTQEVVLHETYCVNLANSLDSITLKGKTRSFSFPDISDPAKVDEAFNERKAFVDGIKSEGLVQALFVALNEFDRTISAALSEGAVESFWNPVGG
jgi:hypothetical protein